MIPRRLPWGLHEASFVYGDPEFRAASDLARRIARVGRVRGLLGASTRDPAATLPVLAAVWRLPVVHITVSRRQAAVWFSPNFPPVDRCIFDGRWGQAVLDLAPGDESYLAGRQKQAEYVGYRDRPERPIAIRIARGQLGWRTAARDSGGGEHAKEGSRIGRQQPGDQRLEVDHARV